MLLIFYIEWDVEMSAFYCSQKMEWINQSVRCCWTKPKYTYIILFSFAIFLGDNWFTVHFYSFIINICTSDLWVIEYDSTQ